MRTHLLVRERACPQVDDRHDQGSPIQHKMGEWGSRHTQAPTDAQHPQEISGFELEGTLGFQGAAVLDDPHQVDDKVEAELAQEQEVGDQAPYLQLFGSKGCFFQI